MPVKILTIRRIISFFIPLLFPIGGVLAAKAQSPLPFVICGFVGGILYWLIFPRCPNCGHNSAKKLSTRALWEPNWRWIVPLKCEKCGTSFQAGGKGRL